jgi:ABC-type sugar transport system permease subunit
VLLQARGDVEFPGVVLHAEQEKIPVQKMSWKYYALFTLPTLLAFMIVFLIPFLAGIYLSFTEFTTVTDARWVGLSNYIRAFTEDQYFLNALWFTVRFAIVSVVLINVISFFLAVLLTRNVKGTNIFRTVFFMPNLIGGIILGYIWQLIRPTRQVVSEFIGHRAGSRPFPHPVFQKRLGGLP